MTAKPCALLLPNTRMQRPKLCASCCTATSIPHLGTNPKLAQGPTDAPNTDEKGFESAGVKGVVVLVHGGGFHSGYFEPFAR